MKKSFSNLLAIMLWLMAGSAVMFSCKVKDTTIQTAIDTKVKGMSDANTVTASVKNGIVTLGGETKDEAGKSSFETALKGIKGVKQVINNITVQPPSPIQAPVVITPDDPLTKSVTDATKDFSTVKASVKDGIITLTGDIKKDDLKKLMMSLNTLKPRKIDNQLTIK